MPRQVAEGRMGLASKLLASSSGLGEATGSRDLPNPRESGAPVGPTDMKPGAPSHHPPAERARKVYLASRGEKRTADGDLPGNGLNRPRSPMTRHTMPVPMDAQHRDGLAERGARGRTQHLKFTIQGHRDIYSPSPSPPRERSGSAGARANSPYRSPKARAYRSARHSPRRAAWESDDSDTPAARARHEALAGRISGLLRGGRLDPANAARQGVLSTLARDVGELQSTLEREIRRRIRAVDRMKELERLLGEEESRSRAAEYGNKKMSQRVSTLEEASGRDRRRADRAAQSARDDVNAMRALAGREGRRAQRGLDAVAAALSEVPSVCRIPGAVTPEAATLLQRAHAEAQRHLGTATGAVAELLAGSSGDMPRGYEGRFDSDGEGTPRGRRAPRGGGDWDESWGPSVVGSGAAVLSEKLRAALDENARLREEATRLRRENVGAIQAHGLAEQVDSVVRDSTARLSGAQVRVPRRGSQGTTAPDATGIPLLTAPPPLDWSAGADRRHGADPGLGRGRAKGGRGGAGDGPERHR